MAYRPPADRMFGKIERDLAAQERDRKDMQDRLDRDAAEAEARLDAPLTRREVLEAISTARIEFAGTGYESSDLIADAFTKLAEALS